MRLSIVFWGLLGGLAGNVAAETLAPTKVPYEYRIDYATYFGGSQAEEAREVIPLADGTLMVGGQTHSANMTVTPGVLQSRYRGSGGDVFLARLSHDGGTIVASTYFGGSEQERATYGMAVDRRGNIVFSTATRSADLPTTAGVYQQRYGGAPADMMAAKVSPDLKQLLWCTYVGSTATDWGRGGLALDGQDNVYLFGRTESVDFPTTPGAYQRTQRGTGDAVVVKLTPDASGLVCSTRLGGSDAEVIIGANVDGAGNIHVVGHTWSNDFPVTPGAPQPTFGGGTADAFLAGFSPDASKLLYSTYLGGSGNEFGEHGPALLDDGSVLFSGVSASGDFPTTPGVVQPNRRGNTDGFLTKLSPDGRQFVFSTLLGGSTGGEFYLWPTPDAEGNIFIVGRSSSTDFPVTANALQATYGGGPSDAVLAVLSPDGADLLYATYLGGSGEELIRSLSLGPNGEVYLVGKTNSADFPITPGAAQPTRGGDFDAFVVRLTPIPEPRTLGLLATPALTGIGVMLCRRISR